MLWKALRDAALVPWPPGYEPAANPLPLAELIAQVGDHLAAGREFAVRGVLRGATLLPRWLDENGDGAASEALADAVIASTAVEGAPGALRFNLAPNALVVHFPIAPKTDAQWADFVHFTPPPSWMNAKRLATGHGRGLSGAWI